MKEQKLKMQFCKFCILVHLGGHIRDSMLLSDGCHQAGHVDDVSPMLAKVRQRQLQRHTPSC